MAMNAAAQSLIALITGANLRFVIPVYQRPYSWDEEQCLQLWDDVLSVGRRPQDRHFTGSIVWVQDGIMSASGVTPLLLIDGQQRITTLTLLIAALADYSRSNPSKTTRFSYAEIMGRGYLLDTYKPGEDRYKLTLSQNDKATLISLLENLADPDVKIIDDSSRIVENFNLFRRRIEALEDPDIVWDGIQRLDVVSISLDAGRDNPQLIFESMNSTGKDLSSADLIRNFVLMGLPREEQNRLYLNHWRTIEEALGVDSYDEVFDEFVRNYLTVLYAPEPLSKRDVYPLFKRHVVDNGYDADGRIVALLKQMESFARYYSSITAGAETEPTLKAAFDSLAGLSISVANPLLLSLYEDFDAGAFDMEDFVAMVRLVESYMFRRAVCDAPTNSLNKFFPSVIAKLNKVQDEGGNYREAFESYFLLEEGTARRFPTDVEFAQALVTRDVYHFRRSFYMLACLENWHHKKDPLPIESDTYTIEHIMPQNALAHDEWREALGPDCEDSFEALVNNLGNLTLTAYNSELSDGTFEQKKARAVGGYENEYLVISKAVRDAATWDVGSIEQRSHNLAETAKKRWPFLGVSTETASQYRVKSEKKLQQHVRVTFKMAFDAGLVSAGVKLVPVSSNYTTVATVTRSGAIELPNGETFSSPSLAAKRVVALAGRAGARNGWVFWRVGAEGLILEELRNEYLLRSGTDATTDARRFRSMFWSGFYEYCTERQGFADVFGDVSGRAECCGSWISFGLGTSKYHLEVLLRSRESSIAVCVWFRDLDSYRSVFANRDDIEKAINSHDCEIIWADIDVDKKTRALTVRKRVDFGNDDWQEMYEWIVGCMWKLRSMMRRFGD